MDLRIDAAALCRILAGRQNVSVATCVQQCNRLKLSRQERVDFIESILYEQMHDKRIQIYVACGVGFDLPTQTRQT
ncbi:hypothetical protein EON76_06655 [bacterium]|nr:MAG: hypothetical protein EON76_06655 [bacterium]